MRRQPAQRVVDVLELRFICLILMVVSAIFFMSALLPENDETESILQSHRGRGRSGARYTQEKTNEAHTLSQARQKPAVYLEREVKPLLDRQCSTANLRASIEHVALYSDVS